MACVGISAWLIYSGLHCIWHWVQAHAPELNKRCRQHLKPTNKSYRTDETYVKVKGGQISVSSRRLNGPNHRVPAHRQTRRCGSQALFPQGLLLVIPHLG